MASFFVIFCVPYSVCHVNSPTFIFLSHTSITHLLFILPPLLPLSFPLQSRGRHQRSRSSSRSRAAAAAGAATASTVTDENRENDKVSESEGKEAAGEKSPPDRDEDGSPPPKTHRGGPWVHRQHSKGVSGGVSGGSVLSPIAMSPMDHHGHTPVIAASSSPAARKNAALIAASLTGSSTSTPKIPANAVRLVEGFLSRRNFILTRL